MSRIAPGDVVVCVDVGPICGRRSENLVLGRYYTVTGTYVAPPDYSDAGRVGVSLAETSPTPPKIGFFIERFRKIEAPNTKLSRKIKSCRPLKERA
jgi:hypothetical protein